MNIQEFDEKYFQTSFDFSMFEYLGKNHVFNEADPLFSQLIELSDYLLSAEDMKIGMHDLPEKKLLGLRDRPQYRQELISLILQYCIRHNINPSFKYINKTIKFLDSFNRLPYLIQIHKVTSMDDWLKLFVLHWTGMDGCSLYIQELRSILKDINPEQVMRDYFPKETYEKWKNLPSHVQVYRGSFDKYSNGLSWSLESDVGLRFSGTYSDIKRKGYSYIRLLTQIDKQGLNLFHEAMQESDVGLFQTTVETKNCLFFDTRSESEIFVPFEIDSSKITKIYDQN
jgi:hypothetical protein